MGIEIKKSLAKSLILMNLKLKKPQKSIDILIKTIILGVIAIFVTLLLYFIWALNRGFEISDEAYYLLLAMHPLDIKIYISAQHWLSSIMWNLSGSLATFRLIGLCLLLLSAFVMTFGVFHAFIKFTAKKLSNWEKLFILFSTLTSALLYGAFINFSPAYNLFVASGSYLALGLTFFTINNSSFWRKNLLLFLIGVAIGIIFISKASAGFSVFCLTSFITIIYQKTILQKLSSILITIFGILFFVVLLSLPYLPLSNILLALKQGLVVFRAVQEEPTIWRIKRYIYEFINQHLFSGLFLAIPIFIFSKKIKPNYLDFIVFGAILYIFFKTNYGISNNLIGHLPSESFRMHLVTSAHLTEILSISLILGISNWTKNIYVFIFSTILFLLPYACSFGTGNNIQIQISAHIASWALLISFIAVSNENSIFKKLFLYILTFTFLIVISYQVLQSSFKPYRIGSSVWNQSIPTEIGRLGIVKVDKLTQNYVINLKSIATNCSIPKNKDYFGLYDMPGAALVIDVIPYWGPWLTNYKQVEYILDKSPSTILKESIIGISLNPDGTYSKFPKHLSKFPQGYIKCGEVTYPYEDQVLQLWISDKKY